MNNLPEIKYLKYSEIDTCKWDNCVSSASNYRVYAMSWFLDCTTGTWDALVYGDYLFVMPLTWKMKYGIKYLYQPDYCQQLGIFPPPTDNMQTQFSATLKKHFRYIDIQINSNNNPDLFEGFISKPKTNLILPLIGNYRDLFAQFLKNTQRNIAKAHKEKVEVIRGLNANEFVIMKKKYNIGYASNALFITLEKIISRSVVDGKGIVLAAYTDRNDLCAGAFILRTKSRLIFLSAFSTQEGKLNSAMYAIVERLLNDYAGTGLLLDFEGSSVEGVARFYKGFGPYEEIYSHLYHSRLPFPFNLFKKNTEMK